MSEISETNVVAAFKNEDADAFRFLYNRFYQVIYLFSFGLVKNEEQAKDIAHSTFTKLLLKKRDFDSLPNINCFLYVTARNESFSYLRHLKVRDGTERELTNYIVRDYKSINDQIDSEFIKRIYCESLNKLTGRMRTIIELLYEDDLTHAEVAERLKISTHTVKNQRAKAIERIRTHFDNSGLTPYIKEVISYAILIISLLFRNRY